MTIKVIALTGNIGSGKSFVLKVCRLLKMKTIELDQVSRAVTDQPSIREGIQAVFPMAWQQGQLDRKMLAKHIFSDPIAQQTLEKILHPAIKHRLQTEIEHLDQAGTPLVIVEIPLLFEAGWQNLADYIILCDASLAIRADRALRRPFMTQDLFEKIENSQQPHALKVPQAHCIIDTSASKQATVRRLGQLFQECKAIHR